MVMLALTASGCAQVLGVDDRQYDPTFESDGGVDPCQTYCATVEANCQGDRALFPSAASCPSVCSGLPPGVPGDTAGNSLACRLTQAELAAKTGEPSFYCPSAGPGGGSPAPGGGFVCGTNCDGYCALMEAFCPAERAALAEQSGSCLDACAKVPDVGGYNTQDFYSGDTLQCRLFHLTGAGIDPIHCKHASGEPPCATNASPDSGPLPGR